MILNVSYTIYKYTENKIIELGVEISVSNKIDVVKTKN